jgi:deoxyribodipyrimidine photolyase-related protein
MLATKPYVSSAAYLNKMGDHCKHCRYNAKAKVGDNACPFNALYWDFFARHQASFERNPRLGMVYQNLRKMDPQLLQATRQRADALLNQLDTL